MLFATEPLGKAPGKILKDCGDSRQSTIVISNRTYLLSRLDTLDGLTAYRIESEYGAYDVAETASGRSVCNCSDFTYRHSCLPYSEGCKHVKALVSTGRVSNRVSK